MSEIVGIAEQRLERAEPEHLVDQLAEQDVTFSKTDRRRFFGEQLAHQRADLALRTPAVGLRQRFEVQPVQKLLVDAGLQLGILRPLLRIGGAHARRRRRCARNRNRTGVDGDAH